LSTAIQTIRLISEMLDSLGIASCLFDDTPATLAWNHSFLELFPEHAGHVHVGEPYSANLYRFYRSRLASDELGHIDRYVADGIERHQFQRLPFVFEHRGQWLRVASLPVPGVGRLRLWVPITGPDAGEGMSYALTVDAPVQQNPAIADVADGLMLRSAAGPIQTVNKRFTFLYRLDSLAETVGQTFPQLLRHIWVEDPMLQQALVALADNQRFAGAPFEIPLPGNRWIRVSEQLARDGSLISTHADISEIRHLQREAEEARSRVEAINQDLLLQIAERERAESQLLQAQRAEAVGQLTGGIAHDFNNLLSVVLGNVELLEMRDTDPDRLRRLAVIRTAAERGASLTRQLLAFARQQPLRPRAVDLNALITGMMELLTSALGKSVVLELALAPDIEQALVDPTQIELVILNLAINARDAMPGGGTLRIATAREQVTEQANADAPLPGAYVCISVSDTGTGMAPEVLLHAFEPFFTTKPTGTGLGLSQVYGLARQSSGVARLRSTQGKGTVVEVILPSTATHPSVSATPAPPSAAPQAGKPARLLVVDDNADVLSTTCTMLRRLGYATIAAADGFAAMEVLAGDLPIDLLLTDMSMPRMSGTELAIRARKQHPDLPVVFFSGYADPAGLPEELQSCQLLSKPVRAHEFASVIEQALSVH